MTTNNCKIIHNTAKCLVCGDIIESKYRHDFVLCSCGNLAVDGGHDYLKRSIGNGRYEELSTCKDEYDEE